MRRLQGDAQWQRDFGALAASIAEMKEHIAAGCMLRDAEVYDEARAELALADEAQKRIEALKQSLKDLR